MLKNKKKLITIFLVLLIGGGAIAFFALRGNDLIEEATKEEKYYSQLTGNEVSREESERPVLGIILGNSPEARPQTGLDSAGIIFETVAEGGITRYLALYQEDMPEDVGPVRSLRSHFLDWSMGFDASIAHVGGSAESLQAAESRNARSLNQFAFDEPYYRTNDRPSPHNMYVKTKGLMELQKDQNHTKSDFDSIPRSPDSPSESPLAPEVTVNFSGSTYQVQFKYDSETNSYIRYLAGEPHIDAATGNPITVKNVVVLRANGGEQVDAVGEGEALVFKDGGVHEIKWQKTSYNQRVQLLGDDGSEFSINRGDTWFLAIHPTRSVSY